MTARGRRRESLVGRQLVLARIARREAMAALADAIVKEENSASLAERSAEMIRAYSRRREAQDGEDLRSQSRFLGSLGAIAEDAEAARRDAIDQTRWHVDTLAAAQTRADRLEKRDSQARKARRAEAERKIAESAPAVPPRKARR
ncbi:hypothetical protein [Qipengyuania nanhaisediminis]|uniref:hypothetical protein n=1 Tax=Qipengyuania nanhaisediminis TaxID=604088 RepID=UPI0038B249E6